MDDSQGTNTETEETTQPEKIEEPTQPREEPTEKTYNEADFQKAVSTGVSKGLESITKQHDLRKTEADLAKAEAAAVKAERDVIQSLQEDTQRALTDLEEKEFVGDSEALKGYRLTRSLELREKKATLREREQDKRDAELDGLRWAITMNNKANELQTQYQVPREALEVCTSEEQMETIAKAFPEVGKETEKKEPPKFAGAGEGGKGADLNTLSSTELITRGVSKMTKK